MSRTSDLFFLLLCSQWLLPGAEPRPPGSALSSLAKAWELNLSRHVFEAGYRSNIPTVRGTYRQRLRHYYDGLEVVGHVTTVQLDGAGAVADDLPSLPFDLDTVLPDVRVCRRSPGQLMEIAYSFLRKTLTTTLNTSFEPTDVKYGKKVLVDEGRQPILVYELSFVLKSSAQHLKPFVIIDACSTDVITYFDKTRLMVPDEPQRLPQRPWNAEVPLTAASKSKWAADLTAPCPATTPAVGYGGNTRTGQWRYGLSRPRCLRTYVARGTCVLEAPSVKVVDLEGTSEAQGRTAVQFSCSQGYNDSVNGAYGVANDAFYFADSASRMFSEWFNTTAWTMQPVFGVHYRKVRGQDFCNSLWDGQVFSIGDGCDRYYPLVSQDVVGHELAHAISDRHSGLWPTGQAGGLSEAFADISGEVAEMYSLGANDWRVGAEVVKTPGAAIRYMDTPSKDGYSISSYMHYYDGLDVHYSAGIFNRAFWNLVTVQGVPLRAAYGVIMYANQLFWGPNTTFLQGACGVARAALDLGLDAKKVVAAFDDVDIKLLVEGTKCSASSESYRKKKTNCMSLT